MPVKLLSVLDGTGRKARPMQPEALKWLEENWDKADVLALQLPTGVGKSFIARTIQRATNARVISGTSNLLMDQYISTYPDVNALKGRVHYACTKDVGLTCEDRKELGELPCVGCPYRECRRKAVGGAPTFFNPMSFYYLQKDRNYSAGKVLVVDEAHTLIDMLMTLSGKRFRKSKYGAPESLDQLTVVIWLDNQRSILKSLAEVAGKTGDTPRFITLWCELEGVIMTLEGLEAEPQNYVFYSESEVYRGKTEEYFCIKPVVPSRKLIRQILDADKIVLLSATLLQSDVAILAAGRTTLHYDSPSPIPAAQRASRYKPLPVAMNYNTPPAVVVKHILALLTKHPGDNAIIHASYDQARKWGPLLKQAIPDLLTHTVETKVSTLETFKTKGGVFLASGCAEGIDLAGEVCRVNIIPALLRLNPTDPAVKKRLAMEGGKAWYDLEALKTAIQQAGRSTRSPDDRSVIYICDPQFPVLYSRHRAFLPKSFIESVRFTA